MPKVPSEVDFQFLRVKTALFDEFSCSYDGLLESFSAKLGLSRCLRQPRAHANSKR